MDPVHLRPDPSLQPSHNQRTGNVRVSAVCVSTQHFLLFTSEHTTSRKTSRLGPLFQNRSRSKSQLLSRKPCSTPADRSSTGHLLIFTAAVPHYEVSCGHMNACIYQEAASKPAKLHFLRTSSITLTLPETLRCNKKRIKLCFTVKTGSSNMIPIPESPSSPSLSGV